MFDQKIFKKFEFKFSKQDLKKVKLVIDIISLLKRRFTNEKGFSVEKIFRFVEILAKTLIWKFQSKIWKRRTLIFDKIALLKRLKGAKECFNGNSRNCSVEKIRQILIFGFRNHECFLLTGGVLADNLGSAISGT